MLWQVILLTCILLITSVAIQTVFWVSAYNSLMTMSKEDTDQLDVYKLKFDSYLKDFNKHYHGEEYQRRLENFKASLKEIAIFNVLEGNTVFGLTKFSDMSKEEFAERYLLKPKYVSSCISRSRYCLKTTHVHRVEPMVRYEDYVPPTFDWRHQKGVVGPILNQKLCSGCWAFSIVGVMESMAAIRQIDYKRRSIQELIDCSSYNNGCKGGNVASAMDFLCNKKMRIVTEEEYPLTLFDNSTCKIAAHPSGRMIKKFSISCNMNEDEIVSKIANHGPLIAVVDATNWMNYIGGIIQRACSRGHPNHAIQIVGYHNYRSANKIPYYVIKNSFGEDFGDQGYVKIAINNDVCGISDNVAFIEVA